MSGNPIGFFYARSAQIEKRFISSVSDRRGEDRVKTSYTTVEYEVGAQKDLEKRHRSKFDSLLGAAAP